MFHNIKKDSIFIADSHFNEKNQELLILLEKIANKQLNPSQLFLMGDIIDFISGESKYFIKKNQELIDIINELANDMQIVYLEGNHDYNMQSLLKNVLIVKRENQPLESKYQDKTVSLSHGDNFTPWHYNLFCKIIRNHSFLTFLNSVDFNNFISKEIYYRLLEKNICSKMKDFEKFAMKRINNYNSDIIIEGHFHQGKEYTFNNQQYINIPSLCCDKKYIILNETFKGENL